MGGIWQLQIQHSKAATIMMMVRRCPNCGEVMYKYKKGENPTQLWKGSMIGIHMIVCDREGFDAFLKKHW